MRYVVAIDVGIKNLGICVFDFATTKFVFWDNVNLVNNGRYIPANNVQYVRNFTAQHKEYFDNAAVVLVERQMRCNMRIIESVLQTLYFEKCIIINARSVKAHYDLGTNNYRMNKQRAVQWVTEFVDNNAKCFDTHVTEGFTNNTKKDDFADALLLITYYLDTYSNQLTSIEDLLFQIADGTIQG